MNYDAAYFIAKFEAIPEQYWRCHVYGTDGRHCAAGHCGARDFDDHSQSSPELLALREIARKTEAGPIGSINDGYGPDYLQPTPKQRILAWLRDAQEAGL